MKIGLAMIVKNEAHIIRRCLDSVKPLIDHIIVSDTGSDDGTQDVISEWLTENNMEGTIRNDKWIDFASNRTMVLNYAKQEAVDYILMVDADFVASINPDTDIQSLKDGLVDDVYNIMCYVGSISFQRPLLTKNHSSFFYAGVLHEFLSAPQGNFTSGTMSGFTIRAMQDSCRGTDPSKHKNDIKVLEKALSSDTDKFMISRYTFYLAQTYELAGRIKDAIRTYEKRAKLGGWAEEIFISLYAIAKMKEKTGASDNETITNYLIAYEACPTRAEALYHAIRVCIQAKRYHHAYILVRAGICIPRPLYGLFVEDWIYDYGMIDVFSVAASRTHHHQESKDACKALLEMKNLPESYIGRVKSNLAIAEKALDKL